MEIAVVMDEQGKTTVLRENAVIKVYIKGEKGWEIKREYKYHSGKEKTPAAVRKGLMELGAWLNGCKLLIAKELKGVYFTFFEGQLFNIWEIEGNPERFLDYIYHSELQEQKKKTVPPNKVAPELVKEGNYYISLKEIMSDKNSLTSKQVLLPFFKEGKFKQIIIDCDHLPRWFENVLPDMGLYAEAHQFRDGLKVTVYNDSWKQ